MMSVDSAWLIIPVILVRAIMQKSPKYFRKILWALVGLRLVIPFSVESAFSLVPQKIPQTVTQVAEQVSVQPVEQGAGAAELVALLWLAVCVAFMIYGIFSYIRLRLRIMDGTLIEGNVYQSEKIQSPFVCGFIKPKIYVPYGLDEATRDCVLAHEKAHIKYADHIIKVIGFIILCIHWFNPLVWASYFMLCKDIELSCDESVIRKYDEDECRAYAKALLDLGVNSVKLTACPIAFGEVSVKERIKKVVSYKKASRILVLATVFVCIAVSVCFMTEPEVALKEKANEVVEITEPTTETPVTQNAQAAPQLEEVTEPVSDDGFIAEAVTQAAVEHTDAYIEEAEEVYDDSMFENEEDGLYKGGLGGINPAEPNIVNVDSQWTENSNNDYSLLSGVSGAKPYAVVPETIIMFY